MKISALVLSCLTLLVSGKETVDSSEVSSIKKDIELVETGISALKDVILHDPNNQKHLRRLAHLKTFQYLPDSMTMNFDNLSGEEAIDVLTCAKDCMSESEDETTPSESFGTKIKKDKDEKGFGSCTVNPKIFEEADVSCFDLDAFAEFEEDGFDKEAFLNPQVDFDVVDDGIALILDEAEDRLGELLGLPHDVSTSTSCGNACRICKITCSYKLGDTFGNCMLGCVPLCLVFKSSTLCNNCEYACNTPMRLCKAGCDSLP